MYETSYQPEKNSTQIWCGVQSRSLAFGRKRSARVRSCTATWHWRKPALQVAERGARRTNARYRRSRGRNRYVAAARQTVRTRARYFKKSLVDFQPKDLTARYRVIHKLSVEYAVRTLCKVLNASFSAYYAWLRSESHTPSSTKTALQTEVKRVFEEHRRRYGAMRISKELARQNIKIGRRATRTAMRAQGLVAIQPKSFVPKTTDSSGTQKRSYNLLLDQPKASAPFQILICDITYIALADGNWLYLASIQDQFTRLIVGWALADNMRTELVIKALRNAIDRYNLPVGCILHSDGGGQYDANEYRALLAQNGLLSSMTRPNNHYDNAQAESVFSRFKAELMQKGAFQAFDDAFTEIFEYIEIYYNRKRLHSSIGYRPPIELLKEWDNNKK